MRLVKQFLVVAAGCCFLLAAVALGALPDKKTPVVSSSKVKRPSASHVPLQVFTGAGPEISVPLRRSSNPYLSQSVSPYILMHTGAREAENNGTWGRHAVKDVSGTVHVLYTILPGNVNRYNCLAAGASAMTFPAGSEPGSPVPFGGGSIAAAPSGRAIFIGAGSGSKIIVSFDQSSCLGSFTADTVGNGGLEHKIYIVDETTWVALFAAFNGNDVQSSRTTDGGETWTSPIPVIVSSFLNFAVTGKGSTIWVASMGVPNDSNVFNNREEVIYAKSTNGGISWGPTISASGSFELPGYIPLFNGSLSSLMVGDTAHVFWLDRFRDASTIFGGHVHHLAVFPNGNVDGPHTVADINLVFDTTKDNSTTGFGLGFGIWQHPTCAYSESTKTMYVLWSQPPDDGAGNSADTSAAVGPNNRSFPNADIFCAVSGNNGRFWYPPQNVTQTNHPGCDGITVPCEHEFYISAAAAADSVIYVVAQVQKFPGFQSLGDPGPDTRLSDEWRLYLVPARTPSCPALLGDMNGDGIHTAGDVTNMLNCVFLDLGICSLCFSDVNCDGMLTAADVVNELNFTFLGIPFPCP